MLKDLRQSIEDSWLHQKSQELTIYGKINVMYDMSIITGLGVYHSKPDQIIWNKEERTGLFVDVAVPMDRNYVKKYEEKLKIYQDCETEVQ